MAGKVIQLSAHNSLNENLGHSLLEKVNLETVSQTVWGLNPSSRTDPKGKKIPKLFSTSVKKRTKSLPHKSVLRI